MFVSLAQSNVYPHKISFSPKRINNLLWWFWQFSICIMKLGRQKSRSCQKMIIIIRFPGASTTLPISFSINKAQDIAVYLETVFAVITYPESRTGSTKSGNVEKSSGLWGVSLLKHNFQARAKIAVVRLENIDWSKYGTCLWHSGCYNPTGWRLNIAKTIYLTFGEMPSSQCHYMVIKSIIVQTEFYTRCISNHQNWLSYCFIDQICVFSY